jgi:hypothetical protein
MLPVRARNRLSLFNCNRLSLFIHNRLSVFVRACSYCSLLTEAADCPGGTTSISACEAPLNPTTQNPFFTDN